MLVKMAKSKPPIRQSEYSEAIAAEICSRITQGQSLRTIGASDDMPGTSTIMKWLAQFPSFVELYMRARDMRSHARFESIDQVMQDLREGVIDANMARVMVDTIKWQCGKECAKRYGERLELAGDATAPLAVQVTFVRPEGKA